MKYCSNWGLCAWQATNFDWDTNKHKVFSGFKMKTDPTAFAEVQLQKYSTKHLRNFFFWWYAYSTPPFIQKIPSKPSCFPVFHHCTGATHLDTSEDRKHSNTKMTSTKFVSQMVTLCLCYYCLYYVIHPKIIYYTAREKLISSTRMRKTGNLQTYMHIILWQTFQLTAISEISL